jgi:hypothetical protein
MKTWGCFRIILVAAVLAGCANETSPESQPGSEPAGDVAPQAEPERTPRIQPGTDTGLYSPGLHEAYDGRFIITGGAIHQVGTLNDASPWDHMRDDGSMVRPVGGTVEIDVDEIGNTGTFRADLELPEGQFVITMEQFQQFADCQDGGIAAFLYEHGDSGCGDANWPKAFAYLAGWGLGSATLNGAPLYEDYQIHFMVTQGMRDRETLATRYTPGAGPTDPGPVNPASQQIDFYIRSPEENTANHPTRQVFDHFFAMEVTWR